MSALTMHPLERQAPNAGSVADLFVEIGSFTLGPLSLQLRGSEILCLLGPNGAGKTTLLRALLGLIPVARGRVEIGGRRPRDREARMLRTIGAVSDDPTDLVEELTAEELWELHSYAHAQVAGTVREMMARARVLAEQLDFAPPDSPIQGYSHGMRKKTQIVAAMLHSPAMLMIDEPRNGLDPIGIRRLEQLLREQREAGTAVIVASHDLYWAERFSDRVCVLAHGRVVGTGPPSTMIEAADEDFSDAFFRLVSGE